MGSENADIPNYSWTQGIQSESGSFGNLFEETLADVTLCSQLNRKELFHIAVHQRKRKARRYASLVSIVCIFMRNDVESATPTQMMFID